MFFTLNPHFHAHYFYFSNCAILSITQHYPQVRQFYNLIPALHHHELRSLFFLCSLCLNVILQFLFSQFWWFFWKCLTQLSHRPPKYYLSKSQLVLHNFQLHCQYPYSHYLVQKRISSPFLSDISSNSSKASFQFFSDKSHLHFQLASFFSSVLEYDQVMNLTHLTL